MYTSIWDKQEKFKEELKSLLIEFNVELEAQDFGIGDIYDYRVVATFNWDKDLADRTGDGFVADLIIE